MHIYPLPFILLNHRLEIAPRRRILPSPRLVRWRNSHRVEIFASPPKKRDKKTHSFKSHESHPRMRKLGPNFIFYCALHRLRFYTSKIRARKIPPRIPFEIFVKAIIRAPYKFPNYNKKRKKRKKKKEKWETTSLTRGPPRSSSRGGRSGLLGWARSPLFSLF